LERIEYLPDRTGTVVIRQRLRLELGGANLLAVQSCPVHERVLRVKILTINALHHFIFHLHDAEETSRLIEDLRTLPIVVANAGEEECSDCQSEAERPGDVGVTNEHGHAIFNHFDDLLVVDMKVSPSQHEVMIIEPFLKSSKSSEDSVMER